jgi:hypothetical protein
VVLVRGQAIVSGPLLDGRGTKIADFLMKNSTSKSALLVELKTPQTQLLAAHPYRGHVDARPVYPPTTQLSGAVAQLLDQRNSLKEEIAHIKHRSRVDIEAFGIDGIVVAGLMADMEPNRIRDFELFRSNLKDVRIITFDEILTSIRGLRDFLAGAAN